MRTALRCACVLVLGAGPVLARATPFDYEALQRRARAMAAVAYEAPASPVPDGLKKFNYDDYQMINFDGAHSWWRREGLPFELQFFHPGWLYTQTVQVNELAHGESSRIPFSPEFFRYGGRKPWHVPADMGFAGFRVLNALNRRDKMDELAVFLGASYFRALGRDLRYGLSARGIAVNTAEPGGEEFPSFREFWVERPVAGANALTLYALMDGPSVTGAYRFVITPGADTVVRVRAVVFCRKNPQVFGVAPLTSMFAHGESTGWARDDYRPEVHDSDGLLVATGTGEWIWRPLANPRTVRVASFMDRTPRGFGLLQRDRVFEHYDDLEACYQQRPSAWVEPVGDWGAGSVRLVELPTPDETNDNIVAFWVPAQLPAPGEPITFEYNLHWFMDPDRRPPAGFVTSTRTATVMGRPALRRFVLEFDGPYLRREPDDSAIEAVVSVVSGAHQDGATVVQKNHFSGTWRVAFEIAPEAGGKPVELRCFLRKGQHVLTETWSYLWSP